MIHAVLRHFSETTASYTKLHTSSNRRNLLMTQNEAGKVSNRAVKSSAFTVCFSEPKDAAQPYSALARAGTAQSRGTVYL